MAIVSRFLMQAMSPVDANRMQYENVNYMKEQVTWNDLKTYYGWHEFQAWVPINRRGFSYSIDDSEAVGRVHKPQSLCFWM